METLRLLRNCIQEIVSEPGRSIPPAEAWIASGWLAALAERAQREEKRRLVAMLDALPDVLMLQDTELRILFMNRAAHQVVTTLTGVGGREALGHSVRGFQLPEAFKQYVLSASERVIRGEMVREEFLRPGPNGAAWQEHFMAPVLDSSGNVEAIAIASRDIQARKI